MDALDLGYVRNTSFSWALWRVLDLVSSRYFSSPDVLTGGFSGAGGPAPQGAAAAIADADKTALALACLELKDMNSPLVLALAEVFALRADADAMALCAQEQAKQLSREEGLVLLAVLAYAANL